MAKENRYKSRAVVAPERLDQLEAALKAGDALAPPDEAELEALVQRLFKAEDAAALVRLLELLPSKDAKRAVNQALYRLGQKGVSIPVVRERIAPIRLADAPEADEPLPVFLQEPWGDGLRQVILAWDAADHQMVFALISPRDGILKLQVSETGRATYQRLGNQLVIESRGVDGSTAVQRVTHLLAPRRLWELGEHLRAGRVGPLVDQTAAIDLRFPKTRPPHPAESLTLPEPASLSELAKGLRFAARLVVGPTLQDFAQAIDAVDTSPLILDEATRAERSSDVCRQHAERWAANVVPFVARELLLDMALFDATRGELAAASAFVSLTRGDDAGCLTGLTGLVEAALQHLVTRVTRAPAPNAGESEPSGIII